MHEKLIIENLLCLYINCQKYQKSNVLSLVASIYKPRELKKYGFEFSNNMYYLSKNKGDLKKFYLKDYTRFSAISKRKINEVDKKTIIDFIKKYSNLTKKQVNNKKIYYLQESKIYIYEKLKEEFPNLKISLPKFYNIIPKNFKLPKKESDKCPICFTGKKLEKKRIFSEQEKKSLETCRLHSKFNQIQKKLYNKNIENIDENSCLMIVDFKQNFKLGKGPVETNRDFYYKKNISCLGFAIVSKENGKVKRKYINYLSNVLSHDSFYVNNCLKELLKKGFCDKYQKIYIWCDNGNHFRSSEFFNAIFNDLNEKFKKTFYLNYFAEYHGKSIVDGEFGKLQKKYNDEDKVRVIENVKNLKNLFERSFSDNSHFFIYKEPKRNFIKKMFIKGQKTYSSFVLKNNNIYCCPISTLDTKDYKLINMTFLKEKDERITRYSSKIKELISKSILMNSSTNLLLEKRFEIINTIAV